jgi:16S rRNA G966 N2-methylase RsmD
MTQEQIVDNIVLDLLDIKTPGSKDIILQHTTKSTKRLAMLHVLDDDRKLLEEYKNIIRGEQFCSHYATDVVQLLRKYVQVADTEVKEHGEVMTPLTLVNEMLDKLPNEVWTNKDLKWLDPCNGVGTFPSVVVERLMIGLKDVIVDDCERYRHIIEKMVYVCEIQSKNMFLFHCAFDREDDHELNTYFGSFLDKGFNEHMLNVWGVDKFDIVLGNPPYKNGTHHKFIVKGFNLLNEGGISLVVHPSTLLLSRKDVRKNNVEKEFLNIVSQYKTNLLLKDCSFYFSGVDLMVPLSITTMTKLNDDDINITYDYFIDKEPKNEIVTTLESVYLHCDERAFSIKQKVFNKMGINSLENNLFRNGKVSPYYLSVNTLIGGELKNGKIGGGFFCLLNKCYENNLEQFISNVGVPISEKVHTNQIGLNSHQECINTANTLLTKFMRFCVSLYKLSGYLTRGELKSVPFIDPTIQWSDEMLFQHFELTQEEINFINEFIGDWYQRDFQNN